MTAVVKLGCISLSGVWCRVGVNNFPYFLKFAILLKTTICLFFNLLLLPLNKFLMWHPDQVLPLTQDDLPALYSNASSICYAHYINMHSTITSKEEWVPVILPSTIYSHRPDLPDNYYHYDYYYYYKLPFVPLYYFYVLLLYIIYVMESGRFSQSPAFFKRAGHNVGILTLCTADVTL